MKQKLSPNLIERAIAAISPTWALERHKSRVAIALSGGYSGAGYHERMAYFQPGTGDADSDSIRDLSELRARSRDLIRNAPVAGGAIETKVTNVIGSGLTLQSTIDAKLLRLDDEAANAWQDNTERRFALWASSELCDAFGQQNFYEQQDLVLRSTLESGDTGTVLAQRRHQGWPFSLALQIIEADRICNESFKADTDTCTAGIERDEQGFPVAAHICNRHPGRAVSTMGFKWTRVPYRGKSGRRNFIHLFRKLRPGQTRGIPELAPIIEKLKQMDRYTNAEVDAAVNSAMLALFAKMDGETFEELFDDSGQKSYIDNATRWDGTLRSGAVVNLLPGESIENPVQNRPNPNFDGFFSAAMTQIGMALNVPKEVLMKHFQSSYSAARAALLDAWRTFRIRRQWIAAKWCQPIYEEWLADEVANGRISAPGFFVDPMVKAAWCGATWSGDGPGAIDPLKEVTAASERVAMGLTTLPEEIIAYDGGDWEQKHRVQTRVQKVREAAGLAAPVNAPKPGAAAPMVAPKKQETEDDAAMPEEVEDD